VLQGLFAAVPLYRVEITQLLKQVISEIRERSLRPFVMRLRVQLLLVCLDGVSFHKKRMGSFVKELK
jgi:hypothetical protein